LRLQQRLHFCLNDSGRGLARRIHVRKMLALSVNDQSYFQDFYGQVADAKITANCVKNSLFTCLSTRNKHLSRVTSEMCRVTGKEIPRADPVHVTRHNFYVRHPEPDHCARAQPQLVDDQPPHAGGRVPPVGDGSGGEVRAWRRRDFPVAYRAAKEINNHQSYQNFHEHPESS
jgi:hypothetical protein